MGPTLQEKRGKASVTLLVS